MDAFIARHPRFTGFLVGAVAVVAGGGFNIATGVTSVAGGMVGGVLTVVLLLTGDYLVDRALDRHFDRRGDR